jgi:hypothetical protein
MEDVKIYGLCLDRLKYQIGLAVKKVKGDAQSTQDRVLLESYNTADIDDIIDILELYDLEDSTSNHVKEKLKELADTVSLLLRETLAFDLTDEGHLGLYLLTRDESLSQKEKGSVSEILLTAGTG